MSATPVNGLSQFVVNYKIEQFGLKPDGITGRKGFRALDKFFADESVSSIKAYAEQMLNQKDVAPKKLIEQHRELIGRIQEFKTSSSEMMRSLDFPKNIEATLQFLNQNVGKLESESENAQMRIALDPVSSGMAIAPLHQELNKLLNNDRILIEEKSVIFSSISALIIRSDSKITLGSFQQFISDNPDKIEEIRICLKDFEAYVIHKVDSYRLAQYSKIDKWIGAAYGSIGFYLSRQTLISPFEASLSASGPVQQEVELDEKDFMEVASVADAQLLDEIIKTGPDSVGKERRTGLFRSVVGKNPYRIGNGYEVLRNWFATNPSHKLIEIFGSLSSDQMEPCFNVLRRFNEVFTVTEGSKTPESEEVKGVRENFAYITSSIQMLCRK